MDRRSWGLYARRRGPWGRCRRAPRAAGNARSPQGGRRACRVGFGRAGRRSPLLAGQGNTSGACGGARNRTKRTEPNQANQNRTGSTGSDCYSRCTSAGRSWRVGVSLVASARRRAHQFARAQPARLPDRYTCTQPRAPARSSQPGRTVARPATKTRVRAAKPARVRARVVIVTSLRAGSLLPSELPLGAAGLWHSRCRCRLFPRGLRCSPPEHPPGPRGRRLGGRFDGCRRAEREGSAHGRQFSRLLFGQRAQRRDLLLQCRQRRIGAGRLLGRRQRAHLPDRRVLPFHQAGQVLHLLHQGAKDRREGRIAACRTDKDRRGVAGFVVFLSLPCRVAPGVAAGVAPRGQALPPHLAPAVLRQSALHLPGGNPPLNRSRSSVAGCRCLSH